MNELTGLQYSTDRSGPFNLYIYDEKGYHRGGVWFEKNPQYPSDHIVTRAAFERVKLAMSKGLEVRICDGGDMMVFHAKGGKILYPSDPDQFWKDAGLEGLNPWKL